MCTVGNSTVILNVGTGQTSHYLELDSHVDCLEVVSHLDCLELVRNVDNVISQTCELLAGTS